MVEVASLDEHCYDELVDASEQLVALSNALRYHHLVVIAELLTREEWHQDVSGGFGRWLSLRYQIDSRLASDLVAVASRLIELPVVMSSFCVGQISWDQLVAVCEYAESDSDAIHAELAQTMTLAQCRLAARHHRRPNGADPQEAHDKRKCHMGLSRDGTMIKLHASLTPDDGAVFANAIEMMRNLQEGYGLSDQLTFGQSQADALVAMATRALGSSGDSRPSLVVHVDAEVIAGVKDGTASIEHGVSVDHRVAQRLACEGRVQLVFDGSDGIPVGVGRQRRFCPAWLERLVRKRDNGCRFTNCENTVFVHSHHIDEWDKDVGPTDLVNLIELCSRHHHYVHEGGWTIKGDPNYEVEFISPQGQVYEGRRPSLQPDVQKRMAELLNAVAI